MKSPAIAGLFGILPMMSTKKHQFHSVEPNF